MDVRKVQDVRKNVEHQYIAEDSKTRIYLSVVREFNEKEYERYSKKKKRAKMKKRIRFLKRSMVYIVPTAISLIFFILKTDFFLVDFRSVSPIRFSHCSLRLSSICDTINSSTVCLMWIKLNTSCHSQFVKKWFG